MIERDSYIHIGWWMLRLGLNHNEMMVYAVISSFCNGTNDHCYRWSIRYICEWVWITRRNVIRNLRKLEERWLIYKVENTYNWVKFVKYYVKEPRKIGEWDTWEWEAIGDGIEEGGDGASAIGDGTDAIQYNRVNNIEKENIDKNINNNINIYSPQNEKTDENEEVPNNLDINLEAEASKKPLGPRVWEVDEVFKEFLRHSVENYASVKYQWMKNWELFLENQMKDYVKLCKEYGEENVRKVLIWIKNDSFWVNQIQSISKLRKKDKEWVPYMVKMIDVLTKGSKKVWWVIEL